MCKHNKSFNLPAHPEWIGALKETSRMAWPEKFDASGEDERRFKFTITLPIMILNGRRCAQD